MIEIDGSFGEGGGSVVRISAALSALTTRPIKIVNIRANRPQKGLAAQHLNAVKAVGKLSQASVEGLQIGSSEVVFIPNELKGGSYNLDVKTAGSISLILQAFMIPAVFASSPVNIQIMGGTDVRWAPSIDYLQNITLPILEKMGYRASIDLVKRGHYPRGGGLVRVKIDPLKKLKPINLLDRELDCIKGISHSVNLPLHVAERQAKAAEKVLKKTGLDVDIKIENSQDSLGPGSGIVLWAEGNTRIGGSSIGERGKRAENVGSDAANELISFLETKTPLDKYMGDQIIPYMALAGNSSIRTAELTLHTQTNIHLVEKLTNKKFEVDRVSDNSALISCNDTSFA